MGALVACKPKRKTRAYGRRAVDPGCRKGASYRTVTDGPFDIDCEIDRLASRSAP